MSKKPDKKRVDYAVNERLLDKLTNLDVDTLSESELATHFDKVSYLTSVSRANSRITRSSTSDHRADVCVCGGGISQLFLLMCSLPLTGTEGNLRPEYRTAYFKSRGAASRAGQFVCTTAGCLAVEFSGGFKRCRCSRWWW